MIRDEQVKQIAREYGRTKGAKELGVEFGVSKQRIAQIVGMLRKFGVDIPKMRPIAGRYRELAKEIKNENVKS